MLTAFGITALLWWILTLIIFLLGQLPRRRHPGLMGMSLVIGAACLAGLAAMAPSTVIGVYASFALGLLLWGCIELAFLLGYVTGPRTSACQAGCAGIQHFFHAVEAIEYNELANLAVGALIVLVTWSATPKTAFGAFLLLWGMRVSAKLNLFLGVRNLADGLLPAHLHYLRSFFGRRPVNWLFPLSIILGSLAVFLLLRRWNGAHDPVLRTHYALLTSLGVFGVLEHWFMVLPVRSERMFSWFKERRHTAEPVACKPAA